MKVILLRDVAKLGKRHAIVETPDGYALNKLIPQGMAAPATPANVRRVEAAARDRAEHKAADTQALQTVVATLRETPLVLTFDANEQDHLFKTVRVTDIVDAATARGLSLPVAAVVMATPIKTVGNHTIEVLVGDSKEAITISISRSTK